MGINGIIFSANTKVADVKENEVFVTDKEKAPFFFSKFNNIETWLEQRAIDQERVNSRILKKALGLKNTDNISTSLSVNAVTLTDNFWFQDEKDTNLTWEDVKFNDNDFSELALTGNLNDFSKKPSKTPELTNIGSFEKCWKKENNTWYLYKKGNQLEIFSELFVFLLGQKLGFNMAEYEYKDGFIRTKDFTYGNKVNYESAYSLVGDTDDYELSFNVFFEIDRNIAKEYLKLIYFDSVCFNVDRHSQNYGVLRDINSGKIIELAPNFDNNLSLISRGMPNDISRENDKLISFFFELLENNKEAYKLFKKINFEEITGETIEECFNEMSEELKKDINLEKVKEFVLNGYKEINRLN